MSNVERYKSSQYVSFNEIQAIVNSTMQDDSIKCWDLLGKEGEIQYIEKKFKKYPIELFENSSTKLQHLFFDGIVKNETDLYDCVQHHFKRLLLPKNWRVSFNIGFCEKNSVVSKKDYDVVKLMFVDGRIDIGYTYRSDPKFEDQPEHNYHELLENFSELDLPIQIVGDVEKYTLIHSQGGHIEILDGDWVKQPTLFYCELMQTSPEEAMSLLQNMAALLSKEQAFKFKWSIISPIFSCTLENEVQQVKKQLASIIIPAKNYEVSTSLYLESLSSIKTLQNSFGKKDHAAVDLFQIEYEQQRVNCGVNIDANNFELYLESKYPIDNIKIFNDKLGTNFS
jgi:hypothetical protein